jgi:hypothetical protein
MKHWLNDNHEQNVHVDISLPKLFSAPAKKIEKHLEKDMKNYSLYVKEEKI